MDINFDNQAFVDSITSQVDLVNKLRNQRDTIIVISVLIISGTVIYVILKNNKKKIKTDDVRK